MRRKGNTRDNKTRILHKTLQDIKPRIQVPRYRLIVGVSYKHNNQPWVGIRDVEEEDPEEAKVAVEAEEEPETKQE